MDPKPAEIFYPKETGFSESASRPIPIWSDPAEDPRPRFRFRSQLTGVRQIGSNINVVIVAGFLPIFLKPITPRWLSRRIGQLERPILIRWLVQLKLSIVPVRLAKAYDILLTSFNWLRLALEHYVLGYRKKTKLNKRKSGRAWPFVK